MVGCAAMTQTPDFCQDPKETYCDSLKQLKFGFPLFSPCNVQLGDVGFIDRKSGCFQALYNIAQPDVDIQGCPPPVTLIGARPDLTSWQAIHVHATSGRRVEVSARPPAYGEARFQFSEVGAGDVILVPGDTVRRESLRQEGELKKYLETHLNWIKETYCCRENISWSEIILVIGTTKTNRWAIAVNTHKTVEANLDFVVQGSGASVWGHWSKSVGFVKSGPRSDSASVSTTVGDEAQETIFINRIQPRGILGKIETSNEPGWGKRVAKRIRKR